MDKQLDAKKLHFGFMGLIIIIEVITSLIAANPDSDSYFLIEMGRYIIENGEIPTKNVWTFHENFNIVIQQWLCDIANYIAYNLGGFKGLYVLAFIGLIIINIAFFKYAMLYTNNVYIAQIAMMISNIVMLPWVTTRPLLITCAFIVFELTALEKFNRGQDNSIKFILKMCLISLLQINWHSAIWMMLLVMMLPYIVPPIWDLNNFNYSKIKTYLLTIVLMTITALLNPNGINAITYLLKSYGNMSSKARISEMLPPYSNSTFGIYIIFVLLLLINLIKDKIHKNELIYLTLGISVLATKHVKNNCLLVFVLIPLIAITLNKKANKEKKMLTSKRNFILILVSYTITSVILAALLVYDNKSNSEEVDEFAPTKAVEYLDTLENKENIRLFTEFNNGAYLMMNGYKVYIDARAEAYTKNINGNYDIYKEYFDLLDKQIDFKEFLDKYNFTHLVVSSYNDLDLYLQYNSGYSVKVDEGVYKVYELDTYSEEMNIENE